MGASVEKTKDKGSDFVSDLNQATERQYRLSEEAMRPADDPRSTYQAEQRLGKMTDAQMVPSDVAMHLWNKGLSSEVKDIGPINNGVSTVTYNKSLDAVAYITKVHDAAGVTRVEGQKEIAEAYWEGGAAGLIRLAERYRDAGGVAGASDVVAKFDVASGPKE